MLRFDCKYSKYKNKLGKRIRSVCILDTERTLFNVR